MKPPNGPVYRFVEDYAVQCEVGDTLLVNGMLREIVAITPAGRHIGTAQGVYVKKFLLCFAKGSLCCMEPGGERFMRSPLIKVTRRWNARDDQRQQQAEKLEREIADHQLRRQVGLEVRDQLKHLTFTVRP